MRVLYLIGGSGRLYGSEMVALNLLKQLSDRVDFIVITSCYGDINKYCEKNKIENYVVNTSFYVYKKEENKVVDFFKHKYRLINAEFKMICAVKKIGKIIDFNTVDIIHSNLSRDLLGAKLSSIYKVPHIWYIQEMYKSHYQLSFLKKNQLDYMNDHSQQFIAISNTVANDWINNGILKEKVTTVYNGIEVKKNSNC